MAHNRRSKKIEHTLSADDQRDLEWYWTTAEGEMGLRSNLQSQLDDLVVASAITRAEVPMVLGPEGQTPEIQQVYVPAPTRAGRTPDGLNERARRAARRAIRLYECLFRMVQRDGASHERILFGVYGPKMPARHFPGLGEFSSIAEYTPIAQAEAARRTAALRGERAKAHELRILQEIEARSRARCRCSRIPHLAITCPRARPPRKRPEDRLVGAFQAHAETDHVVVSTHEAVMSKVNDAGFCVTIVREAAELLEASSHAYENARLAHDDDIYAVRRRRIDRARAEFDRLRGA